MGELISDRSEAFFNFFFFYQINNWKKKIRQLQNKFDPIGWRREKKFSTNKKNEPKVWKGGNRLTTKKKGQTSTNREESKTAEMKETRHVCATEKNN